MGVVYKARQVSLNRIVALKMILAGQLAGEEDVQRFHTEAEAAANLDHPGIVPIYEVGEHEGQHYFSMGYVEGQSLAAKVANGPLPPREAAELVRQVAEAVQYAHQQGVIHRDLKPANVLLDANGHPRVTDFGLAKRVDRRQRPDRHRPDPGHAQLHAAGAGGGQTGPSRARHRRLLPGRGAVLPADRPPAVPGGQPDGHAAAGARQEPVSPRQLNPGMPRDLETICLKCLEKDRARRYATAQELADELERYLEGEPILARPVSRPQRSGVVPAQAGGRGFDGRGGRPARGNRDLRWAGDPSDTSGTCGGRPKYPG